MKEAIFHPEARAEMRKSFEFYEARLDGLGLRFLFQELPVFQCQNCAEYLIEDAVMARIEELLSGVDRVAELEIVQFAA